jgi:hypothetical protein
MKQEIFFNIGSITMLLGCVLLVVLITSFIHHLVGKITRWWNPQWASFLFSVIIGGIAQFRFVEVLEPIHIPVMIGNIGLIYLSAVGFNAAIGKPIITSADTESSESNESKGPFERPPIFALRESWRTRWFV